MTPAEFAACLRILVAEAEDAGLELPAMIAEMEEQAEAMRLAVKE